MTGSAIPKHRLSAAFVGALVFTAACLGGCGAGQTAAPTVATTQPSTTTSPPAPAGVPTAEELASRLLTAGDLGGSWSAASALLPSLPDSGVVTGDVRGQLPELETCPEAGAEAAAAAAGVEWQAFAMLARPSTTTDWPIVLGQFVFAGDPGDVQAVLDALKEASTVCAGVEQVSTDVTEVAQLLPVPSVGDDRFGVRVVSSDAETDTYLWGAFVRRDAVFMFLDLWETTALHAVADVTNDEFGSIVSTAVEMLP